VHANQYLESTQTDQVSYRQLFDQLKRNVPFAEAFLVSSLLRGTLQTIQPQRLSEATLRTYERAGSRFDVHSWLAIRNGDAVTFTAGSDEYAGAFMNPLGYRHGVAVPITAPLLAGYPGALHLYRSDDAPFTDDELECLTGFARRVDDLAQAIRTERQLNDQATAPSEPTLRLAVFEANGTQLSFNQPAAFDGPTLSRMAELSLERLAQPAAEDIVGDRVMIQDATGDYLTYRAVTYNKYPALGGGRFVGFFAQPAPVELASLRGVDVIADGELSRLVPALRFMFNEFRKSPTLVDTAKTVHLSPFHFHRRFSELLGLTPKHFMLDCQMADAKRELLRGEKDLATIAADGGFAHQSHFTSRFKQATGQTPTRWRRMALDQRKGD
jgi:AraC-like DNA-binding protein